LAKKQATILARQLIPTPLFCGSINVDEKVSSNHNPYTYRTMDAGDNDLAEQSIFMTMPMSAQRDRVKLTESSKESTG